MALARSSTPPREVSTGDRDGLRPIGDVLRELAGEVEQLVPNRFYPEDFHVRLNMIRERLVRSAGRADRAARDAGVARPTTTYHAPGVQPGPQRQLRRS